MGKRVFLIVLDSFGIGEMPDSADYGDAGSNTLGAIANNKNFNMPNMANLGFFNIDGVKCKPPVDAPKAAYARMTEHSRGKDTTIGHWEISGIYSEKPLPTFPNGFPKEVIDEFSKATGRGVLCNKPYSGTEVIKDYGKEHVETGKLIVYTSADSVFQIAAHEDVVPLEQLYEYCRIARKILKGKYGVGRVIARPFIGSYPNFKRTTNRHDFSLVPPKDTMLDALSQNGKDVIAVGKIKDIFAGKGITRAIPTKGNTNGMEISLGLADEDFDGLCFINLVDFDMLYGHRNNPDGYAAAATEFDTWLPGLMKKLKSDDILMITADHGCDPVTPSTDHSREYTPLIIYGDHVKSGCNLGTRDTFADISATILDYFGIENNGTGNSMLDRFIK